jgi:hypothetical protein
VSLTSCWQCDLDIPHTCYARMPTARWGMTDEAVAALEGAQRLGYMLTSQLAAKPRQQRRRPVPKKRRWS